MSDDKTTNITYTAQNDDEYFYNISPSSIEFDQLIDVKDDERESVRVLRECIDLQLRKSRDYQNPNSNVTQAMHYRRGVDSIHDIIQGKLYRAQSLLESGTHDQANFESLEDSYKDLINYASFAVAWLRGGVPGQQPNRDIFNKKKD
jgi:hypothetical protein